MYCTNYVGMIIHFNNNNKYKYKYISEYNEIIIQIKLKDIHILCIIYNINVIQITDNKYS